MHVGIFVTIYSWKISDEIWTQMFRRRRIIWNSIHLLHAGEGNMNTFSYFLNPHAMNVLLYRMKPRKHIHVKYCWQAYFISIGTLSQIFKNHIHKCCFPSASDVFLSKKDNSHWKNREASEGVEYDFCPVWSRVLIFTHCPIKLIHLW